MIKMTFLIDYRDQLKAVCIVNFGYVLMSQFCINRTRGRHDISGFLGNN